MADKGKDGDGRDPPIEAVDYIGGVTVIDFGDIRVQRGMTRRPHSMCPHAHLRYDANERRVWCADCEHDVEGFDAFKLLVEQFSAAFGGLERKARDLADAEKHLVRSIAAQTLDRAWRRHSTVPACPYCGNGLFPEDFKNGVSTLGIEFARARRAKAQESKR